MDGFFVLFCFVLLKGILDISFCFLLILLSGDTFKNKQQNIKQTGKMIKCAPQTFTFLSIEMM